MPIFRPILSGPFGPRLYLPCQPANPLLFWTLRASFDRSSVQPNQSDSCPLPSFAFHAVPRLPAVLPIPSITPTVASLTRLSLPDL